MGTDVEGRSAVEAVAKDRLDVPIGARPGKERACTSRLDPIVAILLCEPVDTETGAVAVLGVTPLVKDRSGQLRGVLTDGLGPAHDAAWCPLGVLLVRERHVRSDRRMTKPHPTACMSRHALANVEDLDRPGSGSQP